MGDVQAGAECTDVGVGERLKFAFPGLCHKGDDGHGLNTDSAVGLVAFIVLEPELLELDEWKLAVE